jgi:hypothetical protein
MQEVFLNILLLFSIFEHIFYQTFGILWNPKVITPQIGDSTFNIFYDVLLIGTNKYP